MKIYEDMQNGIHLMKKATEILTHTMTEKNNFANITDKNKFTLLYRIASAALLNKLHSMF